MSDPIESLLQQILPQWREGFRRFVQTGKAEEGLLEYLRDDEAANRAIEAAFKAKSDAFKGIAESLRNISAKNRSGAVVEEPTVFFSKPKRGGMDVAALLAQQAESVARHLLPSGRLEGNEWVVGKSLKIRLTGKMAGAWMDFAEPDKRGDLLKLWASVRGIAKSEALREAQQFVGVPEKK